MMTPADKEICASIDAMQSFVLDAGAGSGKTTSLISALRYLTDTKISRALQQNSQSIACITFTNVAKNEIIERTAANPLIHVSTIHDFLWRLIKPHQKALKRALVLVNDDLKPESKRKRDKAALEAALPSITVNYSDRGSEFLEGRIFHDDLLEVSSKLFGDNPLLAKIVSAKYPYIFIDEYQDTDPLVIDIILGNVLGSNPGRVVIGLFGDKLQSIYDGGVGEVPTVQLKLLKQVTKEENYRCSLKVIDLLNRLRTDFAQKAAGKNVESAAIYVSAPTAGDNVVDTALDFVRTELGWSVQDGQARGLFLTHKLIAKRAGYDQLLDVYQKKGAFSRDQLLKGEDPSIKFLYSTVEPLIESWQTGHQGKTIAILRASGFTLDTNDVKRLTKAALDELIKLTPTATVGQILSHLQKNNLVLLIDDLNLWCSVASGKIPKPPPTENDHGDFYLALMALPYAEVRAFKRFLDESTPFSTKHGVKGAEFDTVVVVLDDKGARWNQYSFDNYLGGDETNADRKKRTRNLFYVCCSRAKANLAVVDLGKRTAKKDAGVKTLFGTANCYLDGFNK